MPAKKIDLTGQVFGRLTVLGEGDPYVSPGGQRKARWHCICECGNERLVVSLTLRRGDTRSCGCLVRKGRKEAA